LQHPGYQPPQLPPRAASPGAPQNVEAVAGSGIPLPYEPGSFDRGGDPDPYTRNRSFMYLKELNLTVNGQNPEQFSGSADKFEANRDFMRLLEVQGLERRNVGNSLTPMMFNRNFYIAAFNLSSSPQTNLIGVIPSTPLVHQMSVQLKFSDRLPHDLVMLVWTQFSGGMSIEKSKKVNLGYYDVFNA
jgi:hypothetical protein